MSEAQIDLNAFRAEVRGWLADNLPPELRQARNPTTDGRRVYTHLSCCSQETFMPSQCQKKSLDCPRPS